MVDKEELWEDEAAAEVLNLDGRTSGENNSSMYFRKTALNGDKFLTARNI